MTVQRFRTKPVEIDAVQFTGDNLRELAEWTERNFRKFDRVLVTATETKTVAVWGEVFDKLHDTWIKVLPGQWIVRGAKGEFYPCDDETFHWKYEPVEEGDSRVIVRVKNDHLGQKITFYPPIEIGDLDE